MASISIESVVSKKTTNFKARVRITKKGKTQCEKSVTFSTEAKARSWANRMAKNLDAQTVPAPFAFKKRVVLIGDLINKHLENPFTSAKLGRSKKANLKRLLNYEIARITADRLTANNLFEHCKTRLEEPRAPKPQTVAMDITNLSSVMKDAGPIFGYQTNIGAFDEAIPVLRKYDLISRSDERIRRPSTSELDAIGKELNKRALKSSTTIPMADISEFAIETCMRRGEICRVKWSGLNMEKRTLTICNRKHPNKKKGNHYTIPLSEKAMEIVVKQLKKRNSDLIFPYKASSITSAWHNVMKKLNIEDLRFHDLRAEGACRLFEGGLNIVEVAKITGHRDLNILNNIYLRLELTASSLLAA